MEIFGATLVITTGGTPVPPLCSSSSQKRPGKMMSAFIPLETILTIQAPYFQKWML